MQQAPRMTKYVGVRGGLVLMDMAVCDDAGRLVTRTSARRWRCWPSSTR